MGLKYIPISKTTFPFALSQPLIANGYTIFIETGTFHAKTAIQAAQHFKVVHSIEISQSLFIAAQKNCTHYPNIMFHNGDSRLVLPELIKTYEKQNLIFWLDAHCGGGPQKILPIITELQIINKLTSNAFIVIDDARSIHSMFRGTRYCEYGEFFHEILQQDRYVSCIDDAFIAAPRQYKNIVDEYSNKISYIQIEYLKELEGKGL